LLLRKKENTLNLPQRVEIPAIQLLANKGNKYGESSPTKKKKKTIPRGKFAPLNSLNLDFTSPWRGPEKWRNGVPQLAHFQSIIIKKMAVKILKKFTFFFDPQFIPIMIHDSRPTCIFVKFISCFTKSFWLGSSKVSCRDA
jgi:hypothetical protein